MTLLDWLALLSILILLGLSGLMSGSETAITGASQPRIHSQAKQGNPRAARILKLWAQRERVITGILIGNNLVNILAASLATLVLGRVLDNDGSVIVVATLSITTLTVIFAEVLPKTLAIRHSESAALRAAWGLTWMTRLLAPFISLVQLLVRRLLGLFDRGHRPESAAEAAEAELRGAIDQHEDQNQEGMTREESRMLRSILDLDEVTIEEVLTPRGEVETLDATMPAAELIEAVMRSPYTRLPVWRDEPDNIIGVIHAKTVLRGMRALDGKIDELQLSALITAPWFVPETTSLLKQLEAFRRRREHFAIVVDEYGSLQGILTLEDILEEIVGEIDDEHDLPVDLVERRRDGAIMVNGVAPLRQLNREFGWQLPDDRASTLAGFLLYESRQIPSVGQTFVFHQLSFEVAARDGLAITKILVRKAQ